MTSAISMHIPGLPVSVNEMYTGKARRYKSADVTKRIHTMTWQARISLANQSTRWIRPDTRLRVQVVLCAPDWMNKDGMTIKKRDCDNYLKCILDVVFSILDADDKQIWSVSIEKCRGDTPETVVRITKFNPANAWWTPINEEA